MSAPTFAQKAARFWQRLPFRHMTALCLILYIFGKNQPFPLTRFPMYSGISEEADVYYVTDQKDTPLSMKDVFDTGSSNTKKRFKTKLSAHLQNLADQARTDKKDTNDASHEERIVAGKETLDSLVASMKFKNLPAGTTGLRLYSRTFALRDDSVKDHPPELLAEHSLPTP